MRPGLGQMCLGLGQPPGVTLRGRSSTPRWLLTLIMPDDEMRRSRRIRAFVSPTGTEPTDEPLCEAARTVEM